MLDDNLKLTAEYWADGPGSVFPPGHWFNITLWMANMRQLNLITTVKLLFLQSNAVYDAGIAIWEAKRIYDTVRPITTIQCLYKNQIIMAWKGPYLGVGTINGSLWQPYQSKYVVTPGFSEWPSGHSGFSSSSAQVLKQFFDGDDDYGNFYTFDKGSSLFEPKISSGQPGFHHGLTDVANSGPNTVGYSPAKTTTFCWDTFSEAASCAAQSRLYGGIHFPRGRDDGARIGRIIGKHVYNKFIALVGDKFDSFPH